VPEIANGNRPSGEPRQVVLVVDDEELVRNFMRRVLGGAGYGVVSASNGQDAMVILKSSAVDLVITDIRMPGMDGRELGTLISSLALAPPVVYASASDNPPATGSYYLPKPFTGPELLRTTQEIIAQHRAPT
jgi:CheY-like chemotaxis protein